MAIRSGSLRSMTRVTLLLAAQATALVALLRAGEVPGLAFPTGDLGQWLVTTPPEQAVMVTLRMVGLVGAGWMLTSSLLYLVVRAAGFPRALRAVNWMTLPVMRRAVDRALALSLTTSTVMGGALPAYAQDVPTPAPPALAPPALLYTPGDPTEDVDDPDDAEDAPGEETREVPAPRPSPIPEPRDLARDDGDDPPPDPDGSDQGDDEPSEPPADEGDDDEEPPEEKPEDEPSDEPPPDAPSVHTVQAGESLWSIAEAHAGADGNDAIAAYWVGLLEANPELAADDPDLIHPGDEITLPQP